jgi:uncharacterized protein (DUF58 family)
MDRSFGRVQFGPGSVIYLGVLALITFAALFTQANLLFWALGLVVGVLAVSVVVSITSLRGVSVQRLTPSRGVAGEPLVLRYHMTNRSRLGWFGVEIVETWRGYRWGSGRAGPKGESGPPRLVGRPHGWVLHIGPGQSIQAEATCWPRRRGLLRFERVIVRTAFPFGIIRKHIEFTQASEVLIHPPQRRMNRQTALSLSSLDIGRGRHSDRGGGQDEFFGLRPYRPGDSFKLIDWKHSARTANLVSREMAKATPPRMMILLELPATPPMDTGEPPVDTRAWADAQEEAISLAGALVREAYLHDIHVGLAVQGAACPMLATHHSQAHHQRLLDSLARLDLDEKPTARSTPPVRPTVVVRPRVPGHNTQEDKAKADIISMSGRNRRPAQRVANPTGRQPGNRDVSVLN